MVTNGKFAPYSMPFEESDDGPVEPWQPPSMFGAITHHRSVSIDRPGPMMPLHQPSVGCCFDAPPIACESPVRACKTRTALLLSAFGSPQVSKARRPDEISWPFSSLRFEIGANWRSPAGSPSRHAPVAGGLPMSWRLSSSVTKAEGTESSEV